MSAPKTYWLAGPDDTRVQVEGAARRDELAAGGWSETTEPSPADRVWLQHADTKAFALFGAGSLVTWEARGWQHAVPPTLQTDTGPVVVLPEPAAEQPVSEVTETPAVTTSPAEKPKTESKKETDRA